MVVFTCGKLFLDFTSTHSSDVVGLDKLQPSTLPLNITAAKQHTNVNAVFILCVTLIVDMLFCSCYIHTGTFVITISVVT